MDGYSLEKIQLCCLLLLLYMSMVNKSQLGCSFSNVKHNFTLTGIAYCLYQYIGSSLSPLRERKSGQKHTWDQGQCVVTGIMAGLTHRSLVCFSFGFVCKGLWQGDASLATKPLRKNYCILVKILVKIKIRN